MSMTSEENKIQIILTLSTKLKVVQKRSGETVPFDAKKIFDAIKKAVAVTKEITDEQVAHITQNVLQKLEAKFIDKTPTVENVQETVIESLMDAKAYKTAEAYIPTHSGNPGEIHNGLSSISPYRTMMLSRSGPTDT